MTPSRTEVVARALAGVLGDEVKQYPSRLLVEDKHGWTWRLGAYLRNLNNAGRLLAVARTCKPFQDCDSEDPWKVCFCQLCAFMKDIHTDCPAAIDALLVEMGVLAPGAAPDPEKGGE